MRFVLAVLLFATPINCLITPPLRTHPFRVSPLRISEFNCECRPELLDALLSPTDVPSIGNTQREYAYQKRRLGEQLRLNKKSYVQREYAYQRRRLGEQLRLSKKKNHSELHVNANGEEVLHKAESNEQLKMETNNVGLESDMALEATTLQKAYPFDDRQDLSKRLDKMRQLVEEATTRPSITSESSLAFYDHTATNSTLMLKHWTKTHLPLPPREDASMLSLFLSPLAHLTSTLFLFSAALFYAMMSVLDAICNDDKIKSCFIEAGQVCKSCFDLVTKSFTAASSTHFLPRILDAGKTVGFTIWFTIKCIVFSAKNSKYANECLDAFTGSVRYGMYTLRSLNVIWKRIIDRIRCSSMYNNLSSSKQLRGASKMAVQTFRRKFHLSRILSSIRNAKAQQKYRRQNLEIQQQRARLEKDYQEKLRSLNQDRIMLERARRALEEERSELICESMNLLAWCSAVSVAPVATKPGKGGQKGWNLGSWWKV